jgi:hypothetical protein
VATQPSFPGYEAPAPSAATTASHGAQQMVTGILGVSGGAITVGGLISAAIAADHHNHTIGPYIVAIGGLALALFAALNMWRNAHRRMHQLEDEVSVLKQQVRDLQSHQLHLVEDRDKWRTMYGELQHQQLITGQTGGQPTVASAAPPPVGLDRMATGGRLTLTVSPTPKPEPPAES